LKWKIIKSKLQIDLQVVHSKNTNVKLQAKKIQEPYLHNEVKNQKIVTEYQNYKIFHLAKHHSAVDHLKASCNRKTT
jgi:hypothetical protein